MIRRAFICRLVGGVLTAALTPVVARAQTAAHRRKQHSDATPSPTPDSSPTLAPPSEASEKNPEAAQLRLWKAADAPDQPIRLRLLPAGKPDAEPALSLDIQVGNYQFLNYVDVPAGPMVAEISSPGQKTALLPIHLAGGGLSTLLVRLKDSDLGVEWIDDTPPTADNGGEFDVYNLLPASGDIQIELGSIVAVHLTSIRGSFRLRAIKRAVYPITINGTDGKGKNFRWNTEADLRQNQKITLLICTDIYGRVRPRLNPV